MREHMCFFQCTLLKLLLKYVSDCGLRKKLPNQVPTAVIISIYETLNSKCTNYRLLVYTCTYIYVATPVLTTLGTSVATHR